MRMFAVSVLVLTAAATIAAGCGEYGQRYTGDAASSNLAEGEEPRITDTPFDAAERKKHGCGEVEEFDSEGRTHTTDVKEKVEYEHNPPHSGNHYQVAKEWGIYDESNADVETVHNLEHGHIVISHKGLTKEQVAELLSDVKKNDYHLLVQPRKKNPKDGVYYTAWTAQLYCKTPSSAALQEMIDNHRDRGPELFTDDPAMNGDSRKDD